MKPQMSFFKGQYCFNYIFLFHVNVSQVVCLMTNSTFAFVTRHLMKTFNRLTILDIEKGLNNV